MRYIIYKLCYIPYSSIGKKDGLMECIELTEMTQKEVAQLLGISQSYISRLEKKIIKRLKK